MKVLLSSKEDKEETFADDELEMIFEEKKLELCIVCFCIVDLSLFEFFIFVQYEFGFLNSDTFVDDELICDFTLVSITFEIGV